MGTRLRPGAAAFAIEVMATAPAMASEAAAPSRRLCGWIVNPTPANWWPYDRTGDWEMAVQGDRQARGMNTVPDLTGHDWQATNSAGYGQGCACLDAAVDARRRRILSFSGFRQLPLRRCRADHALKRP